MIPRGRRPRVPYVYGDRMLRVGHEPARELPKRIDQVDALTPWAGGGWLVASRVGGDGRSAGMSTQGFAAITHLRANLQTVWTRTGGDGFAVAYLASSTPAAGATAYFTVPDRRAEPRGRLRLVGYGGREHRSWPIPFNQVAEPVGITGSGAVVFNLTSAVGAPRGTRITGDGERWRTIRRLPMYSAEAVHSNLVAGRVNRAGCGAVWEGNGQLWRRCSGFRLAAFSPDGRYLAAWHTETGGEFETVDVLDARTGAVVTSTAAHTPGSFRGLPAESMAWEDDAHLLVSFRVAREEEILRMDLHGRLHRATDAVRDRGVVPGFVLATEALPARGR